MAVRGIDALQQELEKTKDSLKDVDDNIKKLTGRDPSDFRGGPQRRFSSGPREDFRPGMRNFSITRRNIPDADSREARDSRPAPGKRRITVEDQRIPAKRRISESAFGRLGPRVTASRLRPSHDSGEEDDAPQKTGLQSSVIAPPQEEQRREVAMQTLNKDEKSKTRNRRMFGLLLGTLQSFRSEEDKIKDKEAKRKAVEQKLEDKAKQEKDELRKERQQLFSERRKKKMHLRRLGDKMELVNINEEWEKQTRALMNFIRTDTKPHIFYLPKEQMEGSKAKLEATQKLLEDAIGDRRKKLEEEIEEIMNKDVEDEEGENDNEEQGENGEEKQAKNGRDKVRERDRDRRQSASEKERNRRRSRSDHSDGERRRTVESKIKVKEEKTDRRRTSLEEKRMRDREEEMEEIEKEIKKEEEKKDSSSSSSDSSDSSSDSSSSSDSESEDEKDSRKVEDDKKGRWGVPEAGAEEDSDRRQVVTKVEDDDDDRCVVQS